MGIAPHPPQVPCLLWSSVLAMEIYRIRQTPTHEWLVTEIPFFSACGLFIVLYSPCGLVREHASFSKDSQHFFWLFLVMDHQWQSSLKGFSTEGDKLLENSQNSR
jgi:hypothetical protein